MLRTILEISIIIIFIIIIIKKELKLKAISQEFEILDNWREIFMDSDDRLIYAKDEDLKYIFINKAVERFYNMDSSEIIGKDDYEISCKEFAEMKRKNDTDILVKKEKILDEITWENRIYKTNKFPIRLINGKYGIGAFVEDITEERERENKLQHSLEDLEESKKSLQLILNSTAEAIYGLDKEGNCTFCNESCLKMLGYSHRNELLGKNMHYQIHHSYIDGTPIPIEECNIINALRNNKDTHVKDEVFWRKDGTSFDVEYRSYPQFKNNEAIGAVVTFMDITERKKAEEEIRYLSYHDSLTGLYNRMYFEEELKRLDTPRNLPISIIHGDANGLKLTNDIFGHAAGDNLLKNIADVFRKVCRADDIIARVGGDEFVILLPKTGPSEAEKIITRIKAELAKTQTSSIKADLSMGSSSKISPEQEISSIIEDAEAKMYQEKTLYRKRYNDSQIQNILKSLHEKYPREEIHSKNVSILSEKIALALNLSKEEVRRVKDAGYLHDIGKIVLSDDIINGDEIYEIDNKEYKQHSVIGYRILNSFDVTLDLAESILAHHENWDGSGYPRGLKGEEIPKLARILAIAEQYDCMTNDMNSHILGKEKAIEEIKNQAGIKFDPEIVEAFIKVMGDKTSS